MLKRFAVAAALWAALASSVVAAPTYLTAGTTTWPVPVTFGTVSTVECLGAAGTSTSGIANTSDGAAGGSGVYGKISNRILPPGATVNVQISAAGGAVATFLKNAAGTIILSCDFGTNASTFTAGNGGLTGNSVGDVLTAGRTGRSGAAAAARGAPGGTGAPGPNSTGGLGGASSSTAGGGGGGPDSGNAGAAGGTNVGGVGGNNNANSGAVCTGGTTAAIASAPTLGAAGCGGASVVGIDGSAGSIEQWWDSTHGPGSGGGGGGLGGKGGDCAGFGSSGGPGGQTAAVGGAAGASCPGLIVIQFTVMGRSAMMMGMGS